MSVLMNIVIAIVLVFGISLYALIRITVDSSRERRSMFVLGLVAPLVGVIAGIATLARPTAPEPCPARLGDAEREVEALRGELFGHRVSAAVLSLAEVWDSKYRDHLQKSASAVHDFVRSRHAGRAA